MKWIFLAAIITITGCASTPPHVPVENLAESPDYPSLESRLTPQWLKKTKRITTRFYVIYYKGKQQWKDTAGGEPFGKVSGDILLLSRQPSDPLRSAIVIPDGALYVYADGSTQIEGRSKTFIGAEPQWNYLVR